MGGEGDENLEKILVYVSIIVFLVSTISFYLVRSSSVVYDFDKGMIGKRVIVYGNLGKVVNANGVWIADVDTGISKVKVVSFDSRPSGNIFHGKVSEYKGNLELVLDG